jgi:glutathione synthase/RimK-type ligase-like ATP-grasp enzyme
MSDSSNKGNSLRKLIILVDNKSEFQISKPDFKYFRSMEVDKIKRFFTAKDFNVVIKKFYELDLTEDFSGNYVLYQTSEAPGSFYKRYIEDLIFHLEKQGAIVLPGYEYLKAHHNKIFMEMMRIRFSDDTLKTVKSRCFGSWVDAQNYQPEFPVVIKQSSSSGGAGVFLARDRSEYNKYLRLAGNVITSQRVTDLFIDFFKILFKKITKYLYPSRSKYVKYDTTPVSNPVIVQTFINGLSGDFKVLVFDRKFYAMYRKNRDNDFRASGSGKFYEVPEKEQEGLLDFARKITLEIDFPIIGMDIGFDGKEYHLLEFQMIHHGTSALQRSKFWHEYRNGKWVRIDGISDLEEEFSRSIYNFLDTKVLKS